MAAVTRGASPRPSMPAGYEETAAGMDGGTLAGEAVEAGDLCYLDGTDGWKLATLTEAVAGKQLSFAAQDYAIGRNDCSFLIKGELDSYAAALVPGDPLWPGTVAGDLVDAAPTFYTVATTPAVVVPLQPKIWAATATRIRFAF